MARKKILQEVETQALFKSRRRCALCFGLQGDLGENKGQLAHIDRNSSNSSLENLVYLCMDHHDQYDSKTSQSKGITPTELRTYRDELHKFLDTNISPWLDSLFTRKKSKVTHNRRVVRRLRSLELYDRRIAIYRAAKELLGKIGQSASVEIADAVAFAKASDEALFLFDDNIDAYLADIYRKAMKLASLKHILDLLPVGEQRNRVVNEQMEIVVWCTNQFDVLRNMLKPFLRVNA